MLDSRWFGWVIASAASLLAVVAVWLVLHNPAISGTSVGDYPCLAPYDTVLNNADNLRGGEEPRDADEIRSRCESLGEERFIQGAITGGLALALGGVALFARRDPRSS